MRLFTGWALAAGLVFTATAGQASDFRGPYADVVPEPMPPRAAPMLLPSTEVYSVLRENGFLPLGIPRQRGLFYAIAAMDRRGEHGRLVIDARDGRIVRFTPGFRIGYRDDLGASYNAVPLPPGPPPPVAPPVREPKRDKAAALPPPRVASHSVPVPKPSPQVAKPAPAPAQQSAAVVPKPAEVPVAAPPAAAPPAVEAKPAAPAILPTQEMPKAQGLE